MKTINNKTFQTFTLVLLISIYSLFSQESNSQKMLNHFQNHEYEKSIRLAEIILDDPNLSKDERINTFIVKGVSEFSSNRMLDAKITFAELLLLDENTNLNTKNTSPKIIAMFEELKIKNNTNLVDGL